MGIIVTKEEFKKLRSDIKKDNKKIILCHGVFDLVHPGHILHFEEAKMLGDVLVVSVTASKFVRKGPGRPYFDDSLRLKFLATIETIDYVILSENYTVDDIVKAVEPDLYVKGKEYEKAEDDITGKISEEVDLIRAHGGDVYFTSGQVFSSTKLINHALPALSDEIKEYINDFRQRYTFHDIKNYIDSNLDLKILVVGDVIIDEYVFCNVQGLMSKDMGYSARHMNSEQYLGGSLAIARHIAGFSNHVTLSSIIGNEKDIHSRLLNELSCQMRVNLEVNDSMNTIVKKRYITENQKREEFHKIFSINNLPTDMLIKGQSKEAFKNKLREQAGNYDVVILCDFGHGLIDYEVMDILQNKAKFLALNCQTNSSNYGMNLITKYKRADIFALDQKELKLTIADYTKTEDESLIKLSEHFNSQGWLTRGAAGATAITKDGQLLPCPAFTLKVKDTIGAGDAFFALASICVATGAPVEVGTFIGNIAGALAANIIGNKDAVNKVDVLKYLNTLLNF